MIFERRGVLTFDNNITHKRLQAAFKRDTKSGFEWTDIEATLEANNDHYLKVAANMQGGGQLVGFLQGGGVTKPYIIDRADKTGVRRPVTYAHDDAQRLLRLTTDIPEPFKRELRAHMNKKGAGFTDRDNAGPAPVGFYDNYKDDATTIPFHYGIMNDYPASPTGLIGAEQIISKKPFVHGKAIINGYYMRGRIAAEDQFGCVYSTEETRGDSRTLNYFGTVDRFNRSTDIGLVRVARWN